MSIMNLFPFQKIYTKKEDLNLLLIDILNLIINKKIDLYKDIPNFLPIPPGYTRNYINIYDKDSALALLSYSSDEYKKIKELDYYKFQTTNALKNYYNLRFSFGFLIADLVVIWNNVYSDSPLSQLLYPTDPKFLFLYLNLFPYKKTWRLTITHGNEIPNALNDESNYTNGDLNALAQDILQDYFQSKMFVKKMRL